MRQILDHTTQTVTVTNEDGSESQQEQLRTVNFIDHQGSLHGLVFHAPGTNVAGELEDTPRIVGQDIPHHAYTSPEQAVDDYENGRLV